MYPVCTPVVAADSLRCLSDVRRLPEGGAVIAFAVSLDGERLCTAGLPRKGVLTAVVDWVSRRADAQPPESGLPVEELELHVGGLDSGSEEHLTWYHGAIPKGSEVVIKILETAEVDQPKSRNAKSESDNYRCSFCNRSQRDVNRLITGSAGAICDECLGAALVS
jgi:hypothetical protein